MNLLKAEHLNLTYWRREGSRRLPFVAVDDVSFEIAAGECMGLIGESGSGKSTVSRIVAGLQSPDSGCVALDGTPITGMSTRAFAASPMRGDIQMVFQDPDLSLNPVFTIHRCIADPLKRLTTLSRAEREQRVGETLDLVGLDQDYRHRLPHQLSGGQKARVGIARAIATSPRLLILDEPTAALDVSVQATIMQLLDSLRTRLQMSYLFITHDLHIVRLIADRIAVMQKGRFVEEGSCDKVLAAPQHPYTQSLLNATGRRPAPPSRKDGAITSSSQHLSDTIA